MRPLTPKVWQHHYTALRPYVLREFPEVDRERLETAADDYKSLVEVVHDSTGLSPDEVEHRLRTLDVEELGLGTGEQEETAENRASVDQNLFLGTGFKENERGRIVERLEKLDRRLGNFPADASYLRLSVKDRERNAQKLTLECEVPNLPLLVATSDEPDLRAALMDVRDDMWEQLDQAINKRKEATH